MQTKKLISILTACILVGGSFAASAKILDADLSKLFMSNVTGSGSFSNQQRKGVIGGSISLRTPISAVNLVAFDPPRFNAGCGGIDLSLGSFSFISSDQLTAAFRQIGASAAPLLFKAVIKGTAPQLDALITEFQALLQNMNNLAKNTCSLAKMIVDPVDKGVADMLGGDGAVGGASGGIFSDVMATSTNYLRSANDTFKKNAPYTPKLGNGVMKALAASGATGILGLTGMDDGSSGAGPQDPNNLNNRVIVSLLGYVISGVPCSTLDENGSSDSVGGNKGDASKSECIGRPLIDLDSFLVGGGAGAAKPDSKFQLYQCMNPGTLTKIDGTDNQICTDMKVSNYPYPGVRGWINTMLFGSGDGSTITSDSILGKYNAGTGANITLTASQQAFINAAGGNLIGILSRVSNPNERINLAQKLSVPMENCVMSELGRALHAAANGIQRGNSYSVGAEQIKNIDKLQTARDVYKDKCAKDNSSAEIVQAILNGTRLNVSNK